MVRRELGAALQRVISHETFGAAQFARGDLEAMSYLACDLGLLSCESAREWRHMADAAIRSRLEV